MESAEKMLNRLVTVELIYTGDKTTEADISMNSGCISVVASFSEVPEATNNSNSY